MHRREWCRRGSRTHVSPASRTHVSPPAAGWGLAPIPPPNRRHAGEMGSRRDALLVPLGLSRHEAAQCSIIYAALRHQIMHRAAR